MSQLKAHQANRQRGFTLLELVSVMAVSALFSSLVIYFTFQYWRSTATLNNDLETFTGRLNAGDRLREALNASSGLINQNSLADSHTGDPDPAQSSGLYWSPIHAVPGNITVGVAGTIKPVLYFRSPSVNTSKDFVMNGTQPYEDEFVLYLDGDSQRLLMRVLANGNAANNRLKTTCPPSLATSTCPTDRVIGENLSSVDLRYFSKSGNLIDHTSIVDPGTGEYIGPDYPAVEVLEMTLNVFKKSTLQGGADSTSQTIIRVALRNT